MIVFAPFTDDQVESLNGFQKSGNWHEFTCGENHAEDNTLIATKAGWVCPSCGYTQDWCHSFMCDWNWDSVRRTLLDERAENNSQTHQG